MWINVTKDQFHYITKIMINLSKSCEWDVKDNIYYIKLTMKDWEDHFPHYLIKKLN